MIKISTLKNIFEKPIILDKRSEFIQVSMEEILRKYYIFYLIFTTF